MDDLTGRTFKGYELQERIGAGGFGAVYRAYQQAVDREVAIKVVLPQFANDPVFIRHFDAEARLVARLEHPFVVPLFDYWREPDHAFLVMRYYPTGSLKQALEEQGTIPLARAADILDQIGSALDAAHRHGVVHRDIKPHNILMDADGNAYLADFGLATTTAESDDELGLTGSPAYISPETLKGASSTPQSDIYSLGYVLFEILTGEHAFVDSSQDLPVSPSDSLTRLMLSHLNLNMPVIDDVPPQVNIVLHRATAKSPEARYPDATSLAADFRRALEQQALFITGEQEHVQAGEVVMPYKGLRPFEEADAADFFGRELLIERLLSLLDSSEKMHSFLAVVGPSGSGKSSVVFAGLLPVLRLGGVYGSENWYFADMVPGIHPLQQLEIALLSVAQKTPDNLTQLLKENETGLGKAVESILPAGKTLLLIIDQFEEVFTQVEDEGERTQFLALLRHAVTSGTERLRVIVTLRADFYDRPLLYEEFGALIQARTQVVLPLTTEEIGKAIVGPAERVGLEVAPELIAAITADVREETGVLPLLQYALTELFARREDRRLTLRAYQESGGVLGALARRAEEIFRTLSEAEQGTARQIFLRLITLGEGSEDTRRRATLSELASTIVEKDTLQPVLDAFGEYRLFTFDRDVETREPTVEIAHEALIREWKRLREWLGQNRNDIHLQRLLAAAAADWYAADKDASYLLGGARLAQYEEWVVDTTIALNTEEWVYFEASINERKQQDALNASRIAHERKMEGSLRRRLQIIIAILLAASAVGIALTLIIFRQGQAAQRDRDNAVNARGIAEQREREARSLTLATNAQQVFDDGDNSLALSLALAAVNVDSSLPETYDNLEEIAFAPGLRTVLNIDTEAVTALAFSPDGRFVMAGTGEGATGPPRGASQPAGGEGSPPGAQPPGGGEGPPPGARPPGGGEGPPPGAQPPGGGEGPPPGAQPPGGEGSPPGAQPPGGGESPPPGGSENQPPPAKIYPLVLWDLESEREVWRFEEHQASISDVLFLPSGNEAISASIDGTIVIWDLNDGVIRDRLNVPSSFQIQLSTSADGRVLLAAGAETRNTTGTGFQILWDLQALQPIVEIPVEPSVLSFAGIMPDGSVGISGYLDGTQVVWDATTGAELDRFLLPAGQIRGPAYDMAISPDGTTIANSTGAADVYLWEIEVEEDDGELEIESEVTQVEGPAPTQIHVRFNADGSLLFVISETSVMGVWDMERRTFRQVLHDEDRGRVIQDVAFSADGSIALIAWEDGTVDVLDLVASPGNQLAQYPSNDLMMVAAFAPTSEGYNVITFGANWTQAGLVPQLTLLDGVTGQVIRHFEGHSNSPRSLAVSPDGHLLLSGTLDDAPGFVESDHGNLMILWNLDTGEELWRVEFEGTDDVHAIAVDPTSGMNGEPLRAATGWGNDIRLWNIDTGEVLKTIPGHTGPVMGVAISPDGSKILSGSRDESLRLWNIETGEELWRATINSDPDSVAISPDGRIAATEGTAGGIPEDVGTAVILWDMATGEVVRELVGHDDEVERFNFNGDGSKLVSGSVDGTMIIWNVETGTILERFGGAERMLRGALFSPDDQAVLEVPTNGNLILWRSSPLSLDEVIDWVYEHRHVQDFTEAECNLYHITDLCNDEGGALKRPE